MTRTLYHLDVALPWLIKNSRITNGDPARRLNSIENQLALLVRQWRPFAPIDVERELRMSDVTRDQLLAWVEERERAGFCLLRRLVTYASGAVSEPSVPTGLIRIVLVSSGSLMIDGARS